MSHSVVRGNECKLLPCKLLTSLAKSISLQTPWGCGPRWSCTSLCCIEISNNAQTMPWNFQQLLCGSHCWNCQHCTENCKHAQMTRKTSLAEKKMLPHCWECQNGNENGFADSNSSCLGGKLSLTNFHAESLWIASLVSSHHAACLPWNCRCIHRPNIRKRVWAYATCDWALGMHPGGGLHCVSYLFHLHSMVTCKDCAKPIQQYHHAHLTLHSVSMYPNNSLKCTFWISNFWTTGLLYHPNHHPPSRWERLTPSPVALPPRRNHNHRQPPPKHQAPAAISKLTALLKAPFSPRLLSSHCAVNVRFSILCVSSGHLSNWPC